MQQQALDTYNQKALRHQIEEFLQKWGKYGSVQRFVRKYERLNTVRGYLADLDLYWSWLPEVGVTTSPDELVQDNLRCVYDSSSTEVEVKRSHTDLMDEYVNVYLVWRSLSFSSRRRTAAAIKEFYRRNDSPLFGDFDLRDDVELSNGRTEPGKKTPASDDVREVLKAMPIQQRAPLVLMLQMGMEPAAALALTWGDASLERAWFKVSFNGRKSHKRPYFKIAGRDSVNHLKIWRQAWTEDMERDPVRGDLIFSSKRRGPFSPGWLNKSFKRTAVRLSKQGLIANDDPDSWHIYVLRHIFSTECKHAGVDREIREFWMGHVSAIEWVYQHPELHEEDFVKEYGKVEPFLSLDYTEAVMKRQADTKNEEMMKLIRDLQEKVDRMASQQAASVSQDQPESQRAQTCGPG